MTSGISTGAAKSSVKATTQMAMSRSGVTNGEAAASATSATASSSWDGGDSLFSGVSVTSKKV